MQRRPVNQQKSFHSIRTCISPNVKLDLNSFIHSTLFQATMPIDSVKEHKLMYHNDNEIHHYPKTLILEKSQNITVDLDDRQ
jgi:hypothetical protein